MTFERELTYAFLELPHVVRYQICLDMELTSKEEVFNDVKVLRKARERNQLQELWERIKSANNSLRT